MNKLLTIDCLCNDINEFWWKMNQEFRDSLTFDLYHKTTIELEFIKNDLDELYRETPFNITRL